LVEIGGVVFMPGVFGCRCARLGWTLFHGQGLFFLPPLAAIGFEDCFPLVKF